MPPTLRSVEREDEAVAESELIVGFDDDLAGEAIRISNRLRGLLTQIRHALVHEAGEVGRAVPRNVRLRGDLRDVSLTCDGFAVRTMPKARRPQLIRSIHSSSCGASVPMVVDSP